MKIFPSRDVHARGSGAERASCAISVSKIYTKAADYARQKGIIIADTKFEFGMTAAGITLADEVLTPDSSRFWPADKYQPGKRKIRSTSNMFGITWKKFAGTSSHRRRPCPRRWHARPAKSIWRPTRSSPGANWMCS